MSSPNASIHAPPGQWIIPKAFQIRETRERNISEEKEFNPQKSKPKTK
jgi:hypothetical protein